MQRFSDRIMLKNPGAPQLARQAQEAIHKSP
jgi:hypothetical protein